MSVMELSSAVVFFLQLGFGCSLILYKEGFLTSEGPGFTTAVCLFGEVSGALLQVMRPGFSGHCLPEAWLCC